MEQSLISLICLDADDKNFNAYVESLGDLCIESVRLEREDSIEDFINYLSQTESQYLCFYESKHEFEDNRIPTMVELLESNTELQIAISPRNYIDEEKNIISSDNNLMFGNACSGRAVLEYSIQENVNLYGDLSCIMLRTDYVKSLKWDIPPISPTEPVGRIVLLYHFLSYAKVDYLENPQVSVYLCRRTEQTLAAFSELQKQFMEYTKILHEKGKLTSPWIKKEKLKEKVDFDTVTLFSTDKGEYYNLKPIADKLKERGYQVRFSENFEEDAQVGIYCQHANWLENIHARFSVILLHDMGQGIERWPDMWQGEPWNCFDVGILPGRSWSFRWSQCASHSWTTPTFGVYELGYPKGDEIDSKEISERVEFFRNTLNMQYDFTVLYAPSTECREMEDDFVRALSSLPVNLLVKQGPWPEHYVEIVQAIRDMRSLHEGKYDNLHYLEPSESIMVALQLCDVIVSDDSGVMTEAMLYGKPAISCVDWLTPEQPSKGFEAVKAMDYVIQCKKVELREYIEKLSSKKAIGESLEEILARGEDLFTNQGHCCDDIVDAIEYYTGHAERTGFMDKKLEPLYIDCTLWN